MGRNTYSHQFKTKVVLELLDGKGPNLRRLGATERNAGIMSNTKATGEQPIAQS